MKIYKNKNNQIENISFLNINRKIYKKHDEIRKLVFGAYLSLWIILPYLLLSHMNELDKSPAYIQALLIVLGGFFPASNTFAQSFISKMDYKDLHSDSYTKDRKNFMLGLLHYNIKNASNANTTFNKSIFNTLNKKSDTLMNDEKINYENFDIKNNIYHIFIYEQQEEKGKPVYNLLHLVETKSYDLNKYTDVIEWFVWHLNNNNDFKIMNEYELHKKIDFLKNNVMLLDHKYDNFKDVTIIRKNVEIISNEFKQFINSYYDRLSIKYDNVMEKMVKSIDKEYKEVQQTELNKKIEDKKDINTKIQQQKKYIEIMNES